MVVSFCCVSPLISPRAVEHVDRVWFNHGSAVRKMEAEDNDVVVKQFSSPSKDGSDNLLNSDLDELFLDAQNQKKNEAFENDGSVEPDHAPLIFKIEGESEFKAPAFGSISGAAIAANFRKADNNSMSSFIHSSSFSAHVLLPSGECDRFPVSNPYNGNSSGSSSSSSSKTYLLSSTHTRTHDESGCEGEVRETFKTKRRSHEIRNCGFPSPSHNLPLLRWPSGEGVGKHLTEKWWSKSKARPISSEGVDGAVCPKPEGPYSRSAPVANFVSNRMIRRPNLGYIWCLKSASPPDGSCGQLLERQYASTIAGEDRCQFVVSEHGFLYTAVFDGFGGDEASEFLNKHLYTAVCEELKDQNAKETVAGRVEQVEGDIVGITGGRKTELYEQGTGACLGLNESDKGYGVLSEGEGSNHNMILESLKRAVAKCEDRFFDYVERRHEEIPELLLVGSCVLVVVVYGDDVYTLSLGDSFAVLGSSSDKADRCPSDIFRFQITDEETTDSLGAVLPSPKLGPESNKLQMLSVSDLPVLGSGRNLMTPRGIRSLSSSRRRLETDLESMLKREGLLQDQGIFLSMEREKLPNSHDELLPLRLLTTSAELLTVEHNTSSPEEVQRVLEQHSDDPEPISRGRVKGKVKVTRCFGAGFLKKRELNENLLGFFRVKYVGDAPYLSSDPDLRHYRLSAKDTCLIVSSDGLYQHLDPEEAVALVDLAVEMGSTGEPIREPARVLMEEAMKRGASAAGIPYKELLAMPVGERRLVHDDISVIVLRFKQQ